MPGTRLYESDWEEFAKMFPKADAWLIERGLVNEYKLLKLVTERNAWQERRFQELSKLEHIVKLAEG